MAKNNHIRKILMILMMLFVMMIPNYIFANETDVKLGDVNSDTKIDISDLTLVLRHISATKTNKNSKWILSNERFDAADINQDEKIDSTDMLSLLRYIAASKSEKISKKHKDWLNLEPVKKEESQPEKIPEQDKEPEKQEQQKPVLQEPEQQEQEKTIEVTSIKLNKKSVSIKEKLTEQLTVEIKPDNATNKIIEWSSLDNEIATVNSEGLVKAKKQGRTKIQAKSSNGKIVYCTITVTDPNIYAKQVKLDKTKLELYENTTGTLVTQIQPEDTTNKAIEWSSSNTDIATVDANGVVKALKQGSVRIIAKTVNGKVATCYLTVKKLIINAESIKLDKAILEIKPGDIYKLTATIEPSNVTDKTITWISSNTRVASIDNNGAITAKAEGTTTITAKTANGIRSTCIITVKKPVIEVTSVSISKTSATLIKGNTLTLTASVQPSNATDKSIKWSTSNSKVATVSNGKITAVAKGTAKITATSSNGKTAVCTITVKDYSVSSKTKPKSAKGNGYTQTIKLGNRTFKLYKQSSGSYANKHYCSTNNKGKSGTISNMGCGPSSVAIILSGYGSSYNPIGIGNKLMKNGNNPPSGLPTMSAEVKKLGRKTKVHSYSNNYTKTYNEMKDALKNGHQIVLYVGKGKGTQKSAWSKFTSSGYHFISVLGIDTSNDKVFVGNPSLQNGWYALSTVVKARGNSNGSMKGWMEIY